MQIISQSYPTVGGPLDGLLLATSWSRVWVHVDRTKLADLTFCADILGECDQSVLRSASYIFFPDEELGSALIDLVLNSRRSAHQAMYEVDGLYVHNAQSSTLEWVQLASPEPQPSLSVAGRYKLLLEFVFREQALHLRLLDHVGALFDALPSLVRRAHPDDPDVVARARQFGALRPRVMSARGWPPPDWTLPPL